MGDLFDFRDGEFELPQLGFGAVDADEYVHIDDSAHGGTETGSRPIGTKHERGTKRKLSKRVAHRKGVAENLHCVEAGVPTSYTASLWLPANRREKREAAKHRAPSAPFVHWSLALAQQHPPPLHTSPNLFCTC